ncbi:DUF998 domain-containing protein [Microtetraspora sp. NBRC 16547]|uniref:DUF998 domain-containing protein n=1 Tax=Microtetraspora sp. NBRC 16547 TaxID=3030993 RepID=UPI002556C8CF|nr:DUF998 domain-containing protein [Microtetraspora sp. NBRC 16547]
MVKRLYPVLACGGIMIAVAAAVVGQIDPDPYLDPINLTLSDYAVLDRSGATEVAMVVLGGSSLALLAGMRAVRAPVSGWPERLMLVWSLALVVAATVPTSAVSEGMTWAAQVHRYVSVAAFVSLPAATAQLVGRFAADDRWKPVARPVEWLTLASGIGLAAMTYLALPGQGLMIGLVERFFLTVEVTILGVLAVNLARLAWKDAFLGHPPVAGNVVRRADQALHRLRGI